MPEIIYFIDDKLGGVSSLNCNLVKNAPQGITQTVILIDEIESVMSKSGIQYPVQKHILFKFSAIENLYAVLKRLRKKLPAHESALILNYGTEMAMLDYFPVVQTTYQLVHDHYNLKLAEKFGHIVDVFICHNKHIESDLQKLFPFRKKDIFYLPHGVNIPEKYRKSEKLSAVPLKLLFLGRMSQSKGVYDLPIIADMLRTKNIDVEWTCIGSGPELENFKKKWNSKDKVSFISPSTYEEVIDIAASHDVFVLPTKFEGSPVSLLETMSVGLVPVITSLPGGIEEIVNDEIGFALPMDDNMSFANAIMELHFDRAKLNRLSGNCRNKIITEFNVIDTSKKYFNLFLDFKLHKKEKILKKLKIGSRLDYPFIPNLLTRIIRSITH
jgi:glycosyltransferase involved in cell wall biosynthesis